MNKRFVALSMVTGSRIGGCFSKPRCILDMNIEATVRVWRESESSGVRVLAQSLSRSRNLSTEEDFDSGPHLSHLHFWVYIFVAVDLTYVQFILHLKVCLYTIVHLVLEEFLNFSQVILKYTNFF